MGHQIVVTITFTEGTSLDQAEDIRQGVEDFLLPNIGSINTYSHPTIEDVMMEVLEEEEPICTICGRLKNLCWYPFTTHDFKR